MTRDGGNLTGLVRVDVDTAEVTTIAQFDEQPSSMAGDGERWYVTTETGVVALPVNGGAPAWRWTYQGSDGLPPLPLTCVPPAISGDDVYIACTEAAQGTRGQLPPQLGETQQAGTGASVLVAALDLASGRERWTWTSPGAIEADGQSTSPAIPDPVAVAWGSGAAVHGLAVSRDHVIVSVLTGIQSASLNTATQGGRGPAVIALDTEGDVVQSFLGSALGGEPEALTQLYANTPPIGVAADEARVYLLDALLRAYDAETLDAQWGRGLAQRDPARAETGAVSFTGHALATTGTELYVTAGDRVLRLQAADGETVWLSDPIASDWEGVSGLLVAGERLYAGDFSSGFHAFDTESGEHLIDHPTGAGTANTVEPRVMYGVGERVVALVTLNGDLTVLGRTELSIRPAFTISNTYPAPGEAVQVDLQGTTPGALAPHLEYRVEWGDGAREDWSLQAALEHTYERAGDFEATLSMRNAAGQRASETVTFHVGGTPPAEPTLLETAFARENQDLTFGILGVALALGGGVVAVGRRRTKRRRVQRELEAIEQAYAETRERPRDCEAALAERRAHVQGLGLDGKLDQSEVLLLQQRIDELARDMRVGTIDREFQFLPHGFVLSLKEMLADGVISVWEREHLERAVEADRTMSAEQKDNVRALLDEWAERDGGADP